MYEGSEHLEMPKSGFETGPSTDHAEENRDFDSILRSDYNPWIHFSRYKKHSSRWVLDLFLVILNYFMAVVIASHIPTYVNRMIHIDGSLFHSPSLLFVVFWVVQFLIYFNLLVLAIGALMRKWAYFASQLILVGTCGSKRRGAMRTFA